jgi:sulfonate transport system permease protein
MSSKNIINHAKKSQGIVLPLIILVTWGIIFHLKIISPALLPAPVKVISTFISLIRSGDLAFNLKVSLIRVITGFLIGMLAGFILGTLMGLSRTVEKLVGPLFHAIRQVPLLGWIPLIVLWCGIGEISKVVLISIGVSYPLVLNTFEGIRSVKKEYIEVGEVFEFNRITLFRKIIFPAALPSILTGIKLGSSKAWMMVVGAEIFIVAAGGIGDMMWEAREHFRMDIVMVGVIVIGIIGFIINQLVRLLEARFLRWRKTFN